MCTQSIGYCLNLLIFAIRYDRKKELILLKLIKIDGTYEIAQILSYK